MDLGRDFKRLTGRDHAAPPWSDGPALELLPLEALRREAAAAGLVAQQLDKRDRAPALIGYAAMLREIGRRTGELETLVKAASAADRAGKTSQGRALAAAKLEQAAVAHLTAELFGDADAAGAIDSWLNDALDADPSQAGRVLAFRAASMAGAALGARNLDDAGEAGDRLDRAVDRLDAWAGDDEARKREAAALHCERADFLIGLGARLKDKALLLRAEADLAALAIKLDPDRTPLTWIRVQSLRGAALTGVGDLTGDANCLAEAVRVMALAAKHVEFSHSPLDRARLSHALALALQALADACDDAGFHDHAIGAFDQAMAALEPRQGLTLRAIVAHDRADALTRRAERIGDAEVLRRAETSLRAELARRDGKTDPIGWAVSQLALARVYEARAAVEGAPSRPEQSAVALTEAMDVFVENGLKSLAEIASDALERLRDRP